MISLKKTIELRNAYLAGNLKIQGAAEEIPLNDLVLTNEALWSVAIAARRWLRASAGREASEREAELAELVEALPTHPDNETWHKVE